MDGILSVLLKTNFKCNRLAIVLKARISNPPTNPWFELNCVNGGNILAKTFTVCVLDRFWRTEQKIKWFENNKIKVQRNIFTSIIFGGQN